VFLRRDRGDAEHHRHQPGRSGASAYPTRRRANTSNVTSHRDRTSTSRTLQSSDRHRQQDIWNENNKLDLVVDVTGYWAPSSDGLLTATAPARIFDTRNNIGTSGGPLKEAETRTVQVTTQGGVPANATGVVLNVTATNGAWRVPHRP
jgi:hypothetical protein